MKTKEEIEQGAVYDVRVKSGVVDVDKTNLSRDEALTLFKECIKADAWVKDNSESILTCFGFCSIGQGGRDISISARAKNKIQDKIELQRCPRRDESPMPDAYIAEDRTRELPDEWEMRGEDRCCSYCGSIHPEDLVRVVREGAVIDPSTKSYKLYIHRSSVPNASFGAIKFYKQHWRVDDMEKYRTQLLNELDIKAEESNE